MGTATIWVGSLGPLLRQEQGGTHIPAPGLSLARWLESQALGTNGTWTGRERRGGWGTPKLLLPPEAGTPVTHSGLVGDPRPLAVTHPGVLCISHTCWLTGPHFITTVTLQPLSSLEAGDSGE